MTLQDVLANRSRYAVIQGDMLDVLPTLPEGCVSVAPFSPPYWQAREYGVPSRVWGGENGCAHEWASQQSLRQSGGSAGKQGTYRSNDGSGFISKSAFCTRCGAWLGCLGQEPTPRLYVEHIVECLRAVKRVLHPTGTVWLNVADSMMSTGSGWGKPGPALTGRGQPQVAPGRQPRARTPGIKNKDMCLIPERLAIAMQEDGWWVRRRITWAKTAAMPSSVEDAPTISTEPIWLLSKKATYFYDCEAVKERSVSDHGSGNGYDRPVRVNHGTRRLRDLWVLDPDPMTEMPHKAPWVREVPRRCILLGTSERGCCPACLSPWRRLVASTTTHMSGSGRSGKPIAGTTAGHLGGQVREGHDIRRGPVVTTQTLGWEPGCKCTDPGPPVPGIVLDPFVGTGRTLEVALTLGLRAIGIELNEADATASRRRLARFGGPHMFPTISNEAAG